MAETNSQDHDLLIKIDTKLERVITDVSDLKTNLSGDVENLKIDHVGRKEFESLTQWRWYIGGIFVILSALITLFVIPSYKATEAEQKQMDNRLQTIEGKLNI